MLTLLVNLSGKLVSLLCAFSGWKVGDEKDYYIGIKRLLYKSNVYCIRTTPSQAVLRLQRGLRGQ